MAVRATAVHHLNRIEQEGAFVGLVAQDEVHPSLDAREERQLTEYVAGITRQRRWLDFLIAHFYRGKLDKMELALKQILRIGLYDLLFLHTPSHAAVHEAVELSKRMVRSQAGGLVNGILRNVLRNLDHLPQPDTGEIGRDLAILHSHPTWMVRRWLVRFGREATESLLIWNNTRPVYGVRANLLRASVESFHHRLNESGIVWEPSPYLDSFVRLPRLQPLVEGGWLSEGWCSVQDESAGLVVRLAAPRPGETVIDTCAAPGGKALYAAQLMQNTGSVRAYDVHQTRLRLVDQAAEKLGITIIRTEAGDLRRLPDRPGVEQADRVLLDAPCTGTGVLAKRADLRWNRSPQEMEEIVRLQDELLDAAARLVRPGGLLVYSTCTMEPEENELRVAAFLERHAEYGLESAAGYAPDEMVTPRGCFASLPHAHQIDGAFGARLRKRA